MTTTGDTITWQARGLTDDVTTCQHCGRENLKNTVRMVAVDADGGDDGDAYMGVVCAARMTGRKSAEIRTEAQRADRARDQAARDARRAWADALSTWRIAQRDAALGVNPTVRECLTFFATPAHRAAEAAWLAANPDPSGPR